MLKYITVLIAGIVSFALAGCAHNPYAVQPAEYSLIASYVDAYNDRDIDAMAALMSEDIQWLSVERDKIEVFANGKQDLIEQMTDYFTSPSVTTSTLDGAINDGNFLAVREIAQWSGQDGQRHEQSALAIYEIEKGLVSRVWYYPSSN